MEDARKIHHNHDRLKKQFIKDASCNINYLQFELELIHIRDAIKLPNTSFAAMKIALGINNWVHVQISSGIMSI
jgi:hypothetical protein